MGDPGHLPLSEDALGRALHRRARLFVEERKDLAELLPPRLADGPTRELLRHGVHARDDPRGVRRDDGIADAVERDAEIFLACVQCLLRASLLADFELERVRRAKELRRALLHLRFQFVARALQLRSLPLEPAR